MGAVTSQIDVELLAKAAARLEEAVIDPAAWIRVMDDLCAATGSTGAVLLQGDVRTPDVPSTASMKESLRVYFGNNWQAKDLRALRGVPRHLAGDVVVINQDLLTPEEMLRDPMHNETLFPFDFHWYAGIGFWAEKALWALVLQRTKREGSFERQDKASLATLSARMSEVATLSAAVGRVALSGITDALDLVRRPVLVLDRLGHVLHANAQAQAGFDDDLWIRDRRLLVRDGRAAAQIDRLVQLIVPCPTRSRCRWNLSSSDACTCVQLFCVCCPCRAQRAMFSSEPARFSFWTICCRGSSRIRTFLRKRLT
jgi:hypothetical protein